MKNDPEYHQGPQSCARVHPVQNAAIFRDLSFISLLSLIMLIKSPAKKTIKPVINKGVERFLNSMTVKKYPFNKPLTRLKQKAEQAISKGIFFPLVLILNGKIIVLLK